MKKAFGRGLEPIIKERPNKHVSVAKLAPGFDCWEKEIKEFALLMQGCMGGGEDIEVGTRIVYIEDKKKSGRAILKYKQPFIYSLFNSIHISSISFAEMKKGQGTKLLSYIAKTLDKFDIHYVIIGPTNGNSSAFAQRRGFSLLSETSYFISSADLKSRFGLN